MYCVHGLLSTALVTSCQFQPMQLCSICEIALEGENIDMEASTVSGFVTLNQDRDQVQQLNNSSCNQTKEVIICNGEGTEIIVESF